MRVRQVTGGAAACAVALAVMTTPAQANDPAQSVEQIAAAVASAVSEELKIEEVSAQATTGGAFTTGGDVTVSIPAVAAGAVTATSKTEAGRVTVTLGIGATSNTTGKLASDGSVVYDGAGASDQTVQPTSDGFRIHNVIGDATAPTRFRHELVLPAGTRLARPSDTPGANEAQTETGKVDNGEVYLLDDTSRVLGGFSPPWAKDANGVSVPTYYEVHGDRIEQIVEHRSGQFAYPVVADPYLGFDMIQSASWAYISPGWTLRVVPTGWSRSHAGGYLPGVYGWRELYEKYKDRGLNKNLDGMRDQYICHQQFVAVRAPTRDTWNLDEWRPDASYAATVAAQCNPS